ncbi:Ribosomal protein L9/RNase H1, N-terminal [Sesbania bispinosa]|nr:Ribosomal protein L9/RNase H1, N-terminal [Sesbania bispinosa]
MSSNHGNRSYAVMSRRSPGVYTSWVECHAQIIGMHNGIYISYDTLEEGHTTWLNVQQQSAIAQVVIPSFNYLNTQNAATTSQRPQRKNNIHADNTSEEYLHEDPDDKVLVEYSTQVILSQACSVLKIPQHVFKQYSTEIKDGVQYFKM